MGSDRAGRDDRTWLEEALGRFEAQLVRYARRILGDEARSRDVVQDTFLKMWRAGRRRVGGNQAAWLFKVCRNQALDVLRKEKRLVVVEPDAMDAMPAQEGTATDHGDRRILRAMERLPANQQEVIRLKFQNGLSYRDISRVTGLSESHVGWLIHTGIKSLRAELTGTAAPPARPAGKGGGV